MSTISKILLLAAEYYHALEKKDVNTLDQVIAKLVKKCKFANAGDKKEIGEQCLKIFNSTNTQGETAVMIAAGKGKAEMLKKWYTIPDIFIKNISPGPDELHEYYKQSNYSYTTQDKEGRNALMLVCQSGNSDCIGYVLSPEIKEILNQKDINNQTPIEYAMNSDYSTLDEFIRVFIYVIRKKSKYFPNAFFRLDKKYADVAYQMEEDMKDDVLNAYKKTNNLSSKVFKKRLRDFSDELEYSSNKRLKTNSTITTKNSKLLETHNSTYKSKESKYVAKAVIKSKASSITSEQAKKVIPQDTDASKVLANNLQEDSYKPGSVEYNQRILDEVKIFVDKINTSSKNYATQKQILSEFRESFCLPKNSFPEDGIQFLCLVDDNNMRVEMIDIILGSSNECNH